jgi:histidinol-phosphate/aromatic aminotransferase/cobyric acid decarboxylase-like protein
MKKIDFAENKNIYMPSKKVINAYRKSANMIRNYPDYKNTNLNLSIANFFDVPVENVTITSGAMEGIYILSSILPKTKTTIFVPTFWGYEDALIKHNHQINKIALDNGLDYNKEKIMSMAKESSVMFLCNPNNPTLSFLDKEFIIKLIESNPTCAFVIDETMLLFNQDFKNQTLTKYIEKYSNLSVIVSFSKIFGLAGIRSGAILSSSDNIVKAKETIVPYSVGKIVEEIIPIALKDIDYLEKTKKQINKSKLKLCNNLSKLDEHFTISGNTCFILLKLPDKVDATKLTEYLNEKNMIVRNIKDSYPLLSGEWIRISVNKPKENNELVKEIKKYEKELNK